MKFSLKSFVAGIIVASIGVATVFAAAGIKSAEYNANKVVFDGKAIDMTENPMISVVKEGEDAFSNYMPLRAVLEEMGFEVNWDGETNTVFINTKGTEDADAEAADESEDIDLAEVIVGFWICADDEYTLRVHLGADGTYTELVESVDGEKETLIGTYTVSGSTVSFEIEGDDEAYEFIFTVAEDGNSALISFEGEELVFTRDADWADAE